MNTDKRDNVQRECMEEKWKIWLSVVIAGVVIAILLRLTMIEFYYNGLSVLAVTLGFCAIGTLQCVSIYIVEKLRGLPQDKREKFWKL